ncbi:MAG TPA: methyl-accepting chemotaxis protein [Malonomonas sp.]
MSNTLSIRWKILVSLLALAIIPMLLLTYLFSNMANEQVDSQIELLADQSGRFVMQAASDSEDQLLEAIELMSKNNELLKAVSSSETTGDFSQLHEILQRYQIQFRFDVIELTHSNGHRHRLTGTHEGGTAREVSRGDQPTAEVLSVTNTSMVIKDGQVRILSTTPLKVDNNIIANLSAYQVLGDKLANHYEEMIDADIGLHDGKNILASSSDELKNLSLQNMLDEDFVVAKLHNRSHVLYNYPLNHKSAGFVIAIDRSYIEAATRSMQRTLLMVAAGVTFVAFFFGMLIAGGIAKPLLSVVRNLQEISEGEADLTQTLKVTSHDEVGLLATSFNTFIDRLREMVLRTRETASSLSSATSSIRSKVSEVSSSAIEQTNALEKSHRGITEIGNTTGEIADNVSNLVASVQQSAAATHELESTTISISGQMENLFGIISDISSSIYQLSSSNEQIDGNIIELSNSARETSTSAEHMEQATNNIEASANQTSQLAQQAASQALEGKAAVQDTIRGISGLQQLIEQAHLTIQELGQRSDAIGSIINVIAEVADQTNLLALNAAIIAAQAGEHGQGFAVVADEIRNLAERTSVSTKEIAEIIENLQQGTQAAVTTIEAGSVRAQQEVARSHAAGEALAKLHESSIVSTEQITSIAQQTKTQSIENRKITQAVLGITKMLEQIALSISQQTASTRNLSSAAESMKHIAGRVKNSTAEQSRGSQQIAQSIEHIQQMIELIDSATRELNHRSNEVVQSVTMVRQIAEDNAERAADMDAVFADLSDQAQELYNGMGDFKIDVVTETAEEAIDK